MGIKKDIHNLRLSMILYLTIIIMVAITSIITISRRSIEAKEAMSIQLVNESQIINSSSELNEAESKVLALLAQTPKITNSSSKDYRNLSVIYYENLRKYLSSRGVNLEFVRVKEVEDFIQGNNELLLLETESDINKMSYEGRKLVIYIYQEIYQCCGLDITFNADNEITTITSLSGQLIYQDKSMQLQAQLNENALVITLSIILSMTALCALIAKKNQLFIKGGKYNGFDEKEFA